MTMTTTKKLYLAYGSNMNKAQMRFRCPAAKPLRAIIVQDARLVFRGVADIEFCEGASVPVVLWEITEACERALDRFEGVGSRVYRKLMIPLDNGEQALTYVMCSDGIWPPQREYYQRILKGYADFGIDPEPLEVALKHSHVKQQHSAATRKRMVRNIAQGRNVIERRPMHVPLSKVDPSAATTTATTATAATREAAGLCKHGWPGDVCEECYGPQQAPLPLPKPDPRYDGYNWSAAAKAGSAKQRVVYTARDETNTASNRVVRTDIRKKLPARKKTRNLSDWLADRKNGGGNY